MASIMTLPDIPLILFYTLTLYFFIRLIYEKKAKLWYVVGGLVGLGLLSKYNMFLVYPAVLAYLLIDKEERFWLKRKEPYLAFLFSIAFFIPVILWNLEHNWISFSFQLYQRHSSEFKFRFDILTQFILVQMIVVSPLLFFGYFKVIFKNFKQKDVKLLSLYGAPIFLIFLFSSLFTEFKIHWAAMAYIPWTILLSNYINWNKFWKYIGIGLAVFLSLFIFTQSLYPIADIPPEDDITTDMHGWDKVGQEVQQIYNDLDKNEWFLFSNRYQLSSQLAFYLPEKDYVYSLNSKIEQFDFWKDQSKLIGENGIFVTHSFYKRNPANLYKFENIELIKTIDILRAGQVYRKFYIYKAYNYQGLK
jgi:undecaprenyl-diphosphatase